MGQLRRLRCSTRRPTKLYGPACGGNTIFTGFGGDCETPTTAIRSFNTDQLADRWIMTQFSLGIGNFLQCVAVSRRRRRDWARGTDMRSPTQNFPIIRSSVCGPTRTTSPSTCSARPGELHWRAGVRVRPREDVGRPSRDAGVLTRTRRIRRHCRRTRRADAAAGRLAELRVDQQRGSTSLNLWKFKPNFVTPASSTFTGPTAIPVSAFTDAWTGSAAGHHAEA